MPNKSRNRRERVWRNRARRFRQQLLDRGDAKLELEVLALQECRADSRLTHEAWFRRLDSWRGRLSVLFHGAGGLRAVE